MVRPLPQVPASLPLPDALSRLRRDNSHLALVTTDDAGDGDGGARGPGRGSGRDGARRDAPCLRCSLERRCSTSRVDRARATRIGARVERVPRAAPGAGASVAKHTRCGTSCSATTACGRASCAAGIPASASRSRGRRRGASSTAPATAALGDGVAVTREYLRARVDTVAFIADLLRATAARPARLNCFGCTSGRWSTGPPTCGTARSRCGSAPRAPTRWSSRCRCAAATSTRSGSSPNPPRRATPSTLTPRRPRSPPNSRAACTPTWISTSGAYKLGPLVDSELLIDCLELAADARELDMRASPYDLTRLRIRADRHRDARRPGRVRPGPAGHRRPRGAAAGRAGRPRVTLLLPGRAAAISRCYPRVSWIDASEASSAVPPREES